MYKLEIYLNDKLFGVNAELLIDHAWGWEPCTIADIKAYKPMTNSIGSGQVLQCGAYAWLSVRHIVISLLVIIDYFMVIAIAIARI